MPAAEISGIERTYRRFGLIPDTLAPALHARAVDRAGGRLRTTVDQVLYVVDGADPAMVGSP
jgi:hypothetical protein